MIRRRAGAGTSQRFVLLAALFVAASLSMLSELLLQLTDPRNDFAGCELAAGIDPTRDTPANYLLATTSSFHTCVTDFVGPGKALWQPLSATVGVLMIAFIVYLLIPGWKEHRTPVGALEDAEVTNALAGLATRSESAEHTVFVENKSAIYTENAIVYGRRGRYTVRLDAGLVVLFSRDRAAFEATVLHELAHIRNRDVEFTYLTVAIWRVFLACVLAPFVVVTAWNLCAGEGADASFQAVTPTLTRDLVQAVVLVLLMYLTTADLLRTREIHADLDACAQAREHVSYWKRQRDQEERTFLARRVLSLVRVHPTWAARVAALGDESAPVTVQSLNMFLTGVSVEILGYLLTFTPGLSNYLPDWLADPGVWPAAALATAVAATAVWRGVVNAGDRTTPSAGLRAGLWMGAGQLVGELTASQFLGNQWTPDFPEGLLLVLPLLVPAAVLWWTAACAASFADLPPGRHRSTAAATLTTVGLTFAWWYGWWQAAGTTFAAGMPYSSSSALALLNDGFAASQQMAPSTTSHVIADLTIVVVSLSVYRWSILLTAALWIIPLLRRTRARSNGTLVGLCCGTATAIGIVVATNRAQRWIYHDGSAFVPSVTVYTAWLFLILFCGATVAALTAALVGRGSAVSAITAAGSATAIGLVVLIVVNQTDGCVHSLDIVYPTCQIASGTDRVTLLLFLPELLAVAGSASIIAAVPFAALARFTARGRPAKTIPKGRGTRFRHRMRLAGTAAVCTVLLGSAVASYTGDESQHGDSNVSRRNSDPFIADLDTGPRPAMEEGRMAWAWGYFGGGDIMRDYEDELGNIDDSVAANGDLDTVSMRRGCADLVDTIQRAHAYFSIPIAAQQAKWEAALAATHQGAEHCLQALAISDPKGIEQALAALNPPVDPVAQIIDYLNGLITPVQHLELGTVR